MLSTDNSCFPYIPGVRPIHVCAATGLRTGRESGFIGQRAGNQTTVSRCSSWVSGHSTGHQPSRPGIVSLMENMEINGNDKPKIKYDCPRIPGLDTEIDIPESVNTNVPIDIPEQKEEMNESPLSKLPELKLKQKKRNRRKVQHDRIVRHIKMKRHQLRRVRKRLWPIRKKEKFLRRKRQERLFNASLEEKRDIGRKFDAEKYVKEVMERAKKAGYKQDYEIMAKRVAGIKPSKSQ